MMVIGLVGKRGVGKDSVAELIRIKWGFGTASFAAPVKQACASIFCLDAYDMEDRTKKETIDTRWGISPRQMMQLVGTDCVRKQFGEDHWLKHMELRLKKMGEPFVVITDVRFANEAEMIKQQGGLLIGISRPTLHNSSSTDAHCSESGINDIAVDYVLHNDGDLEQLAQKANMLGHWVMKQVLDKP